MYVCVYVCMYVCTVHTRNTCVAEPRAARGKSHVKSQEWEERKNRVNCVTGEGTLWECNVMCFVLPQDSLCKRKQTMFNP